jgi:hypothetical protein
MRLSTSSFSSAAVDGPWLRTWLVALVLGVTGLLGWELALRKAGYRPTVVDDKALWASQRQRVYTDCCEGVIVLLGDCRMQFGLVPDILREQFPRHRTVQLAVEGTSPVATLRDLAADENFRGIVICGLDARELCLDMWETQQCHVAYYHRKYGLNEKLNRRISCVLQSTFAFLHPQLRLDAALTHWLKNRHLPLPYYVETRADRSRLGDYSLVDIETYRQWSLERARLSCTQTDLPSPALWLEGAKELEPYVAAIEDRGGRVLFVRLPVSGEYLAYEEETFPKQEYWDAFAASTSALCLHFRDLPSLAGFDCPDTSHLDRRDAPRFTTALAKVLEDCGMVADSACAVCRDHAGRTHAGCRCHAHGRIKRLLARTQCNCFHT